MTSRSDSIECNTLATRPNASAGRAEADDFAIVRALEPADDVDGIGRGIGVIERTIQMLERVSEIMSLTLLGSRCSVRVHVRGSAFDGVRPLYNRGQTPVRLVTGV